MATSGQIDLIWVWDVADAKEVPLKERNGESVVGKTGDDPALEGGRRFAQVVLSLWTLLLVAVTLSVEAPSAEMFRASLIAAMFSTTGVGAILAWHRRWVTIAIALGLGTAVVMAAWTVGSAVSASFSSAGWGVGLASSMMLAGVVVVPGLGVLLAFGAGIGWLSHAVGRRFE